MNQFMSAVIMGFIEVNDVCRIDFDKSFQEYRILMKDGESYFIEEKDWERTYKLYLTFKEA